MKKDSKTVRVKERGERVTEGKGEEEKLNKISGAPPPVFQSVKVSINPSAPIREQHGEMEGRGEGEVTRREQGAVQVATHSLSNGPAYTSALLNGVCECGCVCLCT